MLNKVANKPTGKHEQTATTEYIFEECIETLVFNGKHCTNTWQDWKNLQIHVHLNSTTMCCGITFL